MFLETPRLRLRPFVPEDAEAVFYYGRDPDLMRYIPVGTDETIEDTVGLAHPENAASIRVMNELGMTYERPIRVHGMDCVLCSNRTGREPRRPTVGRCQGCVQRRLSLVLSIAGRLWR